MPNVASSFRHSRLVLCPYGIPVQRRVVCTTILLHCGGDLNRVIDSPAGEQPFLRHLQRLTGMLDALRAPIVFLTDVSPLMPRVVLLRERYEAELGALRQASWVLFLDGGAPAFVADALRQGRLERRSATAIWQGPARMRFLIVSPESTDPDELEAGMLDLAQAPFEVAGEHLPSSPRIPITRPSQHAELGLRPPLKR
jgi:hypothetical protein